MKKCTVIMTIMAFVMSMMAVTAFAAVQEGDITKGEMNWDGNLVQATGYASGRTNPMARRAARMDAIRNLAEQVVGTEVTAESKMIDLVAEKDVVYTRVQATVSNMQEISPAKYFKGKDGLTECEIVMAMPIFGAKKSVASTFGDIAFKDCNTQAFPQPTTTNVSVSVEATTSTTTTTTTTNTNTTSVVAAVSNAKYTGLIVNCQNLKSNKQLKPVMSPVIKNESGTKIYGHVNLNYDLVIEKGMASYVKSKNDSAVSRAGNNPLVVNAVDVADHNGNPVVSVADSDRILIANQSTHFLDSCSVVFVR